jgi:diguanylate cyclase (GGDEF)-like protein/putative nucleotidyltransferase with HDIG domain
MNYLFIIVGLEELQFPSAILIGVSSVLAQTLIGAKKRPKWEQLVFNVFAIPVPLLAAHLFLRTPLITGTDPTGSGALILGSMIYFLVNTTMVAVMIGLAAGKAPYHVWQENFLWTWPQYLVGGAIAGALHWFNHVLPWQGVLLTGPPLYLVYRSYSLYLGRLDEQQKHILEMADLHWRTIEALALAIEAKDDSTAAHLRRVQVYAAEVAKELQLSPTELNAVQAAALLHDVGKLAVPEYIISKPGKLTPEEFEKMKIHPAVGAEILERVKFPYPVAPIVRAHHEKFDGSGYPERLKGEEIPIGARIISAVDTLDALASDRQYRPAIPLEQAIEIVKKESGRSFDPRVVDVLARRYQELERKAKSDAQDEPGLDKTAGMGADAEPAVGFEEIAPDARPAGDFTLAIANARREVQLLVEITGDLGNSLSLDETLALLAVRLGTMIPNHAIVIYLRHGNKLIPHFVQGESHRLLSSLEIPVGEGLSGWVAENDRAIVNGNPAVEAGYLNDPSKITSLLSAISVPLPGHDSLIGVVTLYHLRPNAFSQDHLRMLLAIRTKVGLTIENAIRFGRVEKAAEKDELTGLLNAGSIFSILNEEIETARREQRRAAVIVLDLNGFKSANDAHGHLAGNRILQEIAGALTMYCRKTEFVGRMGGDEFVIVLSNPDDSFLVSFLGHIQKIGPEAGNAACGDRSITISSGVAIYPRDGHDGESLLEAADRRMYEAKRQTHAAEGLGFLARAIRPQRTAPAEARTEYLN